METYDVDFDDNIICSPRALVLCETQYGTGFRQRCPLGGSAKTHLPQGILYDKKNRISRTPEVNRVFWEIVRQTGGTEDNEKGTNCHFDSLSLAAEKAGLLPRPASRLQ